MSVKASVWLLIIGGIFGFVIQVFPTLDNGPLSLLLFSAMLLTVEESNHQFDEHKKQLLLQAYSTTFRRSLVVLIIVYMFSQFSIWFGLLPDVMAFLNAHWLPLTFFGLCLLLGITGLQSFNASSNTAYQPHPKT